MNEYFEYMGYHFKPYKQIDMTFEQISKRISRSALNLHKYEGGKGWNYAKFYKASGNSQMDVFLCKENGNLYLPADNELFLFTERK